MYEDVFIYVPSYREIIRIAEGSGDNLDDYDIEQGFKDYIYYDRHSLENGLPEKDGGMVMLTELFRDIFDSTNDENCIAKVLDMAYGDNSVNYILLNDYNLGAD